ncbi:pentapeptide repeat-containing protein [Flagellimonas eckloniae]|uniref:Pentapeptide repeat-containing protein n=1 Tax=Flagellimonas eckloniae TaxID=346185 RepID=A0A0Q1H9H5_9FLAO|nr:pentapeptide repeat-containing protein [Allomuricauda eckloniae]KQC30338.1 pentapeptide repeat-containing protein [Allomuricauda eckloniae]
MSNSFIADKTFDNQDYSETRLKKADYENCIFKNCKFSNGFLDNQNFMECQFLECDLTNANVKHTIFKECLFTSSKLMGLRFEDCNDFLLAVEFENSDLSFASFFQLSIKNTPFKDCKLIETDFTEADLTLSTFTNCNIDRAIFNQTILEKADFRTSFNFDIDPQQNKLKKARFSKENLIGLLKKHDIVVT